MKEKKGDAPEPKKLKLSNKTLSTALIIIGIIVIFIPIVGKVVANKQQDQLLEDFYLAVDNQAVQEDSQVNAQLDTTLIWGASEENQNQISETGSADQQLQESKDLKTMPKPIGILEIDKIDLKLGIAEGVDLDILKFALGHMTGTAELGGIGNSVIAGHRTHTFNTFFNRLDEMEIGDLIKVTNGAGVVVTYEVYEKLYVKPTDTSVLNTSNEYRVLTLITCHPEINPTSRLILHALDVTQKK